MISKPLIWIWTDWQPMLYSMPDKRRVYPELAEGIRGRVSFTLIAVGQKGRETPQVKCVLKLD